MMRSAAYVFVIALWLSIIIGSGVLSYQQLKVQANAWENSHPEYCTNQYDRRCGDKNPWGAVFMFWLIGFPFGIAFGSAWYNPRAEALVDKWFPKDGS